MARTNSSSAKKSKGSGSTRPASRPRNQPSSGGQGHHKKSTKRYQQKGHLAKEIQDRRKRQEFKAKVERRKFKKGGIGGEKGKGKDEDEGEEPDENDFPEASDEDEIAALLNGEMMSEDDEAVPNNDERSTDTTNKKKRKAETQDEEEEEDGDEDEDDNLSSLDIDDAATSHLQTLQSLSKTDPEFYKFLQENDKELLDFNLDVPEQEDEEVEEGADDGDGKGKGKKDKGEEKEKIVVTIAMVRQWEKSLVKARSLGTLRKLLLAFRSAARSGNEDEDLNDQEETGEKKGKKKKKAKAKKDVDRDNRMGGRYLVGDDGDVFNRVVITALRYTPMMMAHHLPAKQRPNGKYTLPTHTSASNHCSKILKSYFSSLLRLMRHLPISAPSSLTLNPKSKEDDDEMDDSGSDSDSEQRYGSKSKSKKAKGKSKGKGKGRDERPRSSSKARKQKEPVEEEDEQRLIDICVKEGARMTPWLTGAGWGGKGGGKLTREWVKSLLEIWSSMAAPDRLKLQALLTMRQLIVAGDVKLKEWALKNVYTTFISSSRQITPFTLPSLLLMKNSASELFALQNLGDLKYVLAFGYIRQLAMLLRHGMKKGLGGKDSLQKIYNWQVAHSIDFWCQVLGKACDRKTLEEEGTASGLEPLIYPLVQVGLGMLKLNPHSRYHLFHFHLVSSLIRLSTRTGIFIPIVPFLISVLTSSPELSPSSSFSSSSAASPKPSTLRPLDFDYYIKAPNQYLRTKVYAEGLAQEASWLLGEWFAIPNVGLNVGFPEVVLPTLMTLKKILKKSTIGPHAHTVKGKDTRTIVNLAQYLKPLIEKLEAQKVWMEEKRKVVEFGPGDRDGIGRFVRELMEVEEAGGAVTAAADDEKTGKVKKEKTSPLGGWVRLQRKVRERKREMMEKAARGEDED